MVDIKPSFSEYDSYSENYFTNNPIINYEDYEDIQKSVEDNLTLMGENITANSTSIEYTRDEFLAKIEKSVLGLIFILTITGNFLVLVGIHFRNQKMTRMYYFILHLSIADLTTAFFNVLTQLFWEFTHRFQGGGFMCKFVKYTQILGPYSSSYILVMTALDRYQAICYPLSNCSWTAGRSKLMLGTAWTFSFLFCLPQLHIFNYQEVTPGVYDCWGTFEPHWGEKAYITWYCITVFIIPLIILIFAYTCITRVIWLNFNMKNAILKEERLPKGVKRVDSDDAEDVGLSDKSLQESDNSISRERQKYPSVEDPINKKNSKKSLTQDAGVSNPARNLEVRFHPSKQVTKTRTSLNMSCSKGMPNEHSKEIETISPQSRYYEEGHYTSDKPEPLNNIGDKDSLNQKQYLLSSTSTANIQPNIVTNGNFSDSKGFLAEKRQKWTSMSAKFSTHSHEGGSSETVEPEKSNGDYQKNTSKQYVLARFNKDQKLSDQALKPRIAKKSSNLANNPNHPRTHSVKGISRAKIKTVKLTVTVICCYIICSTPFIAALLWSAYDPYAKEHPFFFGPTFTILTLLASLNSCANAWIVLFFNPNLLQSFVRGTCQRNFDGRERQGRINSMSVSQKRPQNNKNTLVTTNSNQMSSTSVVGLSPLMSRFSKKETLSHRLSIDQETMELVSPPVNTSSHTRSRSRSPR